MRRVFSAAHGDYVLCCKFSDRDAGDQWQVGYLDYCTNFHNTGRVRDNVFVMQNPQRSYFKICYLITPDEGHQIVESGDPASVKCDAKTPKVNVGSGGSRRSEYRRVVDSYLSTGGNLYG